jgi:TRAP-type transport system periplasmic protein
MWKLMRICHRAVLERPIWNAPVEKILKEGVMRRFIVVLVLVLIASAAHAQQKISIGFSHFWPATYFIETEQFPRYFKMVEKATQGKYVLDVKMYPAEALLKAADQYDGVVKGVVDTGTSSTSYNYGRFPVMLTLNQPGLAPPRNADAACQAAWEFYNTLKPKEWEDIKILYVYATGPGWLFSNRPVAKVEDLKGLKLRLTGAGVGGAKIVGAQPVAIPMSEAYLAASKGIIDALINPSQSLDGWKLAEVFKYSTFFPYFYSEFFWVGMNLKKWNSLPKDLRDAFDSVAPQAVKEAGQLWEHYNRRGLEYGKKHANQISYFPDAEAKKLTALLTPIEKEYKASLDAKGLPGEKIIETAQKIMEKCNKLTYEQWKP